MSFLSILVDWNDNSSKNVEAYIFLIAHCREKLIEPRKSFAVFM